ncbi:hypothetical protein LTR70_000455 [Exophiala xenobiotica]|uniref:Uncharacterized protein n=1 Tax=Lithohypha guttulata TaxID=1690604 RepID=A0ABR0KPX7_9EURO|nr:hypothetical protein LTR24_000156 [Lithohypha guttulata]KAK5330625.1 hypothetical protein LTR70_000455 [Exophiala xenobiotica]
MNGTLPGLLDDPNINTSLPTLNDVHIPPLRNPAPSRSAQAPLPLELIDRDYLNDHERSNLSFSSHDDESRTRVVHSAPAEPSSAREVKKPHLAISELVDAPSESDSGPVQLPSFVSLSVVEKSPTQKQLNLNNDFPNKRPRLEPEPDISSHDVKRLLPRPVQKDDKHVRPLLPAMVTGLHEPPPSAALLPSMVPDARPTLHHRGSTSMMQVKDMIHETQRTSHGRPPERMLNTPEVATAELPRLLSAETETLATDTDTPGPSTTPTVQEAKKESKVRRTRRRWTQAETDDLLAGVKKHGFGKWKQILHDPAYIFVERTSIDLKDRFRVFAKDYPEGQLDTANDEETQPDSAEAGTDTASSRLPGANGPLNRQRRKRHPWTKEEDQALLNGVQKYGFQWTDIHNDPDLGLSHRRATDLRDRIRNLYPDGYKHAEARPLRAEIKKAEKAGKKETPAGTLYAPPGHTDTINFPTSSRGTPAPASAPASALALAPATAPRNITRRQTASPRVPSIASLTGNSDATEAPARPTAPRRSRTITENATVTAAASAEPSGITLPSLALDAATDTDDWDNTLPPFINWEP